MLYFTILNFLQIVCLVYANQAHNSKWSITGQNLIGVPPNKLDLYQFTPEQTFRCLDGSKFINSSAVNDDYCDCRDASDEPGTAACPHGTFFCENLGYISRVLPSGWVNDKICDCCDGSDEYNNKNLCKNDCESRGASWREEQERFHEMYKQGSEVRRHYKDLSKSKMEKNTKMLEVRKQELSEKESEVKMLEDELAVDYGPDSVFYILKGECFKFQDHEYIYSLCPFDKALQESNGVHTELGKWHGWANVDDNAHGGQKYEGGYQCWNGPSRSTTVNLRCGVENLLKSVTEPSRCEYLFDFETPAACPDLDPPTLPPAIEDTTVSSEQQENSEHETLHESDYTTDTDTIIDSDIHEGEVEGVGTIESPDKSTHDEL